ncbi:hypothetical protein [Gemmatimonas sp.]|uniref:hypothetical protein n=1 Tax=Gemmatimonas sp. TaxID=1962908 RepID=UPI00286E1FA3|nr:hypothetical protein [Gemmatimonas sp.]
MRLLASHHNARVVVIATLVLGAGDIRAQGAAEVLSNDDVIQMVKGDLSRDLIVAKILGTRPGFDVTAPGIVRLVKSEVHWKVIREMITALQAGRANGNASIVPGTQDEVLKNEDIVLLVSSRVDPELINLKMRTTRLGFDMSAAGMVRLNQSKVPTSLIKAMMAPPLADIPVVATAPPPTSKPAHSTPIPSSPSTVSAPKRSDTVVARSVAPTSRASKTLLATIPSEPGIYLRVSDLSLSSLEPNSYTAGKTSNMVGSALTYGIAKMKFKAVIQNGHASIQTRDGSAEFYFVFEKSQATLGGAGVPWGASLTSPNQFVLMRLDERAQQREVTTASANAFGAQSGTDAKYAVPFTFTKLRTGVYRVVPNAVLAPGEYAFFPASPGGQGTAGAARLYDFGVSHP